MNRNSQGLKKKIKNFCRVERAPGLLQKTATFCLYDTGTEEFYGVLNLYVYLYSRTLKLLYVLALFSGACMEYLSFAEFVGQACRYLSKFWHIA